MIARFTEQVKGSARHKEQAGQPSGLAGERIIRSIGERVQRVRSELQLTQRELAKRLAVSPGYLSDIENGNTKANADVLAGLVLHFPQLNPEWLLTGRGEMLLPRGATRSDGYNLDIEALKVALVLFYNEVSGADNATVARLLANQPYFLNQIYRVYTTNFDSLVAQGVAEQEARAAATAECEQLDKKIPV